MAAFLLLIPASVAQANQTPSAFVDLWPEHLLPIEQPQFPDYRENYQKTVVEPATERAEQARLEALEAARQAELVIQAAPIPQPTYKAPVKVVVQVSGNCESWMAAAGITDRASAYALIMRESGCNPNSVNTSSGSCGIGQQLPCGKWPHQWNDPVGAMIDMQNYVFSTYGSWANALGHSYRMNWY